MTTVKALLQDRRAAFGALVLIALAFVAVFAPLLTASSPTAQENILQTRFLPPFSTGPDGASHLLGTDRFGRDLVVQRGGRGRFVNIIPVRDGEPTPS